MQSEVYVALIADQVDSRHSADRVPAALEMLGFTTPALAFQRTAGDEIQALFLDAHQAVAATASLMRAGSWRVGLGVGTVEEPLPDSTLAARGAAYVAARDAVARARSRGMVVAVQSVPKCAAADDVETVCLLLAPYLAARSHKMWQAVDLADSGLKQTEIAAAIGIAQASVSRRLHAAHYEEVQRGVHLAAEMLARLMEKSC